MRHYRPIMSNADDGAPLSKGNSRGQIPLNLVRTISSTSRRDVVNKADIDKQLDLEKADNSGDISGKSSSRTSHDGEDRHPEQESNDKTILSFRRNDPDNPYCWSSSKKLYVTITGMYTSDLTYIVKRYAHTTTGMLMVMNSTIGSSIATGASGPTSKQFGISNQAQLVLPTSMYLVGYVLGPLFFSPLSETYGRKWVMISTFTLYTAFTLGCALAPSWAGLVIMRLLAGTGASTPISIIGGIYADIYGTPKARGRAMAIFMACTTWGPILGPVLSGYIAVVSWRWAYWLQLILAGITWPFLLLLPETYGPIVLKSKAKKMRKQTGNGNVFAPSELEKRDLHELLVVILTRPIRMFLFEGIVLCSCLYLSLVYAIFYSRARPHLLNGILDAHTDQNLQCSSKRTRSSSPASTISMPANRAWHSSQSASEASFLAASTYGGTPTLSALAIRIPVPRGMAKKSTAAFHSPVWALHY